MAGSPELDAAANSRGYGPYEQKSFALNAVVDIHYHQYLFG
jgi:hypothetical protein